MYACVSRVDAHSKHGVHVRPYIIARIRVHANVRAVPSWWSIACVHARKRRAHMAYQRVHPHEYMGKHLNHSELRRVCVCACVCWDGRQTNARVQLWGTRSSRNVSALAARQSAYILSMYRICGWFCVGGICLLVMCMCSIKIEKNGTSGWVWRWYTHCL